MQPQKNSKDFRGSYKPMVLANDSRVIVACDVHPSSETEVIPTLLDRAQVLGPVETALFDAGFFSDGILETTEQRGIELLCPEGQSLGVNRNKQSDTHIPKSRFIYLWIAIHSGPSSIWLMAEPIKPKRSSAGITPAKA